MKRKIKVGNLVRLGKHTFYPLEIGQVIDIVDNWACKILVCGDIKTFADFDYEVINENR